MENQPPAPTANNQPANQYNSDFISSNQDNVFNSADNHKVTSVKLKKSFGSVFIAFSILTLMVAILGAGYFFWTNISLTNKLTSLNSQKEDLEKKYNNAQNQKIISQSDKLINRSSLINGIINQRINWKKVFKIISIESYRNVKYTNLAISKDKTLTLAGECIDEPTFSKIYRAWEQSEYVDSIIPGTFQRTENNEQDSQAGSVITFSLSIKLNDKIFNSDNLLDTATASDTNSTTSTSTSSTTPTTSTTTTNPTPSN